MRLSALRTFTAAFAIAAVATGATAAPIIGLGDPLTHPALTGGTQEGFDAVATGQYASLTLGNVTYIGVDAPFDIDTDFNGSFNTTGGKSMLNDFDLVPSSYRFNFGTPVSAFAFNWGAADFNWTLRAFDAGNNLLESLAVTPTFGSNAGEYFGIATPGIAYATLTLNPGESLDYVFIDRFTISDAAAVPEPLTLALFGAGLAGIAAHRRRARR